MQQVWYVHDIENVFRAVETAGLATTGHVGEESAETVAYLNGFQNAIAAIAKAFGIPVRAVAGDQYSTLFEPIPANKRYLR